MGERIIKLADLTKISNSLNLIHEKIQSVDNNVAVVGSHVDTVEGELNTLKQDFDKFVNYQVLSNREQVAETRLVKIRQELEKRFGHYDVIRRTATGILQATDIKIIRQDIINNASEEMMLTTPGYWLAPCLVALAAWISDKQELAERAMKEAIHRDDEKTSLFFALICRRAGRKIACVKWVNRYLMGEDEEALDRKTILVLSAYANGLWGTDAEGKISRQMESWIENLESKPGVVEKQREQWEEAIKLMRPSQIDGLNYPYLKKYSSTWPELEYIMKGAYLHGNVKKYLTDIFEQEGNTVKLVQQLDEVLNSLVVNFDDEELPLREKEKLEQLVLDFGGDENEAKKHMAVEKTAFENDKDFIQLLTDASLNPKSANADIATQKFAMALSKEWLMEAYRDVIAENRSKIPTIVKFELEDFCSETSDGKNEEAVIKEYNNHIDILRSETAKKLEFTAFEKACKYIRVAAGILGLLFVLTVVPLGIILLIIAIYTYYRYGRKKGECERAQKILDNLEERRKSGAGIIRAILAEVVDIRHEFYEKDQESNEVMSFIDGLNANQFVEHKGENARRVMI